MATGVTGFFQGFSWISIIYSVIYSVSKIDLLHIFVKIKKLQKLRVPLRHRRFIFDPGHLEMR